MSLKIVKATEPMQISNIVLTVYAAPGYGKTSLAFTADKALLLDFDKGSYRAAKRGDAVPVASWSDVQSMTAEDLKDYNTIVIDTAGRALDALAADIINSNPKAGRGDGSLTLQGFGTLKSRFAQWQGFLRSLGKDLVLVAHMAEEKSGDDIIERIDAQGASKNEIYKSSDAMCRIRLDAKDQRYLDFDPRSGGFGKNPAQLPKFAFPNPTENPRLLADVIQQIKDSINKLTATQADAVNLEQQWEKAVGAVEKVGDANLLVEESKKRKLSKAQKTLLAEKAKSLGFTFDKTAGAYAAIPSPFTSEAALYGF